ncbi:MAG: hypothetical protein QXX08_03095 [Candidatus Bathyarchaeia archaeon]
MTATKLDLTNEYKTYYTAKTTPEVVEFDEAHFLAIEGKGAPGSKEFAAKIEALYPVAYGVKSLCKKQGNSFGVPKLEGLWWVKSDKPAFEVPREEWRRKLLIRMPKFVTSEIVEKAKAEIIKKKGIELAQEIMFEKTNGCLDERF